MSKSETIAALRASAAQVFSEVGYYGASLREIAAAADVPLSTIHTYFGSKADLFADVIGDTWREIESDRIRILAERTEGGRAPTAHDIVYALAYPIVARARSPQAEQFRAPRLLRHWVVAPREVSISMRKTHGTEAALKRWIDMLTEACHPLSKADAMWGFSFLVGSIYSWELTDKRYDSVVGFSDDRSAEELTNYLVEFIVAGLRDMGQRQTAAAARVAS
jgi:AcrR family transcriptional regulator